MATPHNPSMILVLDLMGKLWTLPNTVLGLAYGLLGFLSGTLAAWAGFGVKPRLQFGHNALQFLNNPLTIPGTAITLGNTISYGRDLGPDDWGAYGDPRVHVGRHEEAHTYQYQLLGPGFLIVYFLAGGISGPERNPLEASAQTYGRRAGSWWPW